MRYEPGAQPRMDQDRRRLGGERHLGRLEVERALDVRRGARDDRAAAERRRSPRGGCARATTSFTCGERSSRSPSAAMSAAGRPISSTHVIPMTSGGWCMAITVGTSGTSCAATHSTSSAPSSRPGCDVSQTTIRSPPASRRVLQRRAEQVVIAGELEHRHRQRGEQLVGPRVLGRVAGVRDVAGDEHGSRGGRSARTRSTAAASAGCDASSSRRRCGSLIWARRITPRDTSNSG